MKRERLQAFGVGLGVASGLVAASLGVVFLVANPYGGVPTRPWTFGIFAMLTLLAAAAVISSLARRWLLLLVLFGFSFFLLSGFYLLLTPSIYSLVGVAHLGYLAAAVVLWRVERRART